MFANLSQKLVKILDNIRNRGILTEDIIDATIREIRISLLEADVALSVVKSFSKKLKEKLLGQKVLNTITPEQTVIKAVYDELVDILGNTENVKENKSGKVLILGLQGTGKSTTAAKLANLIQSKYGKKIRLVSLDTYRPAAIKQLEILAQSNKIDFFNDFSTDDSPLTIAQKAMIDCKKYDVTIFDTAGRIYLDDSMMQEISELSSIIQPDDSYLVIDSMMGQDALNTAKAFNETVQLTGLILTRIDGDAKGGAALSAKYVTNCPIRYICTGEKISDIEVFHPDRIASRILDKGDVLTLVEKAMDSSIADEVKDVAIGKDFDLNGMEKYLKQLEKIGGINSFLKFIPGMGKIKEQLKEANISDKTIAHQIAIIRSMTAEERKNPKILNASRRRRIAAGSAQQVSEVNKLIKQFEQIKTMMTKFNNPGFLSSMSNKFIK